MAGEAKTDNFMLGTATLMLGPLASLMALNKAHSVGLVKNIKLASAPQSVDLTQGVRNSLVYSVMTGNPLTITGEVYEYTLRNLIYSASLDGSVIAPFVAGDATVGTLYAAPVDPAILGSTTLAVDDATDFAQGDRILIQGPARDQVFVRKVNAIASNSITMDYGLPISVAIGAKVSKVQVTTLGAHDEPPYLSAKIVGELANGKQVSVLIPKVKITSGLNLAFQTDNYQNMPWEIKVFDQLETDPFYADFATASPGGKPALAKLAM